MRYNIPVLFQRERTHTRSHKDGRVREQGNLSTDVFRTVVVKGHSVNER